VNSVGQSASVWIITGLLVLAGGLCAACLVLWRRSRRLARENAACRQRAEQAGNQLARAQRMEAVGLLAGGIVNNLNNLLAVIMGRSRLAMQTLPPETPAQDEIRKVVKAGGMAVDLVQEISDFYTQADRAHKPTDLPRVVTETLELLQDILPANLTISQNLDPQVGPVMASSSGVQQILMNLFSLAARSFGTRAGQINVALQRKEITGWHKAVPSELGPGQYVKLTVSDNGPGMDPKELGRIFDAYQTHTRHGQTEGLEMNSIYRMLEDFDGVTIAQSRVGRGTCFEVYFPSIAWSLDNQRKEAEQLPPLRVIQGHSQPVAAVEDGGHPDLAPAGSVIHPEDLSIFPPPKTERGTVLLVDDEEMVAKVLTTGLRGLGFRVIYHTDSRKALADFVQTPDIFDALVTDQIMPHMSGVRLTRKIHELRSDLPVILVTGFRDSFNDHQAREAGVTDFLLKPTSYRDLADLLDRIMLRSHEGRG